MMDEAKAILEQPNTATATGSRDRAMLLLMYQGGLRVGEVVGLTRANLQANGRKLVVRGKGDKERMVILDGETREALQLWLTHRRRFVTNGGPLFCRVKGHTGEGQFAGEAGKALTTRAVQGALKRYAEKALGGIRGREFGCHALRHTHGKELVEANANLRTIQDRLGHARVTQTQVYTQVSEAAQEEAVRALETLHGERQPDAEAQALAARIAALSPEAREALRALLG
jgi:site-specific recombinase XerD